MNQDKALAGVTILDLTRVLAGPYCTAILADLGAEVIKLEVPGRGDDSRYFNPFVGGESAYYMNLNRNKKGITLNLKGRGKELFLELVKKVDVVTENFRPGTMDKLGLGYSELQKVNPGLIYAAISGFGQDGPYKDRAGYDLIAQALSGIMSVTGWPDRGPARAGFPAVDVMGGLSGAIGILAALQYRQTTGQGQMIDVSLLDSAVAAMEIINQIYLVEGRVPQRRGNRYESACPNESYLAEDGEFVIAAANDTLWKKVCTIIGRDELFDDPRYQSNHLRVQNHEDIRVAIEEWTKSRKVAEVVEILLNEGVPAAPINDVRQVVEDPHIAGAREMFVEIDHPKAGKVKLTGPHIKFSKTRAEIRIPPPVLGQHNEEIFSGWLGLNPAEMEALKAEGII